MNWNEFWQIDLIQCSLIGTALLSLNYALIGTTLVEKKLTLIGDSFSHAILPGVVLSTLYLGDSSFSLLVGGWAAGFVLVGLTLLISKRSAVYTDSLFSFLALFFVAAGTILSYKTKTSSEILHLLFGQVLSFDPPSVLITLALTILTFLFFLWIRRSWSLWIVDPGFFEGPRLNKQKRFLFLFISLSLLMTHLSFGLNSLGAFMTVGLVVIPSLIAQQWAHRLYRRLGISAAIAVLGTFLGFSLSLEFEWPVGPSVIVILSVFYILTLILRSRFSRSRSWA